MLRSIGKLLAASQLTGKKGGEWTFAADAKVKTVFWQAVIRLKCGQIGEPTANMWTKLAFAVSAPTTSIDVLYVQGTPVRQRISRFVDKMTVSVFYRRTWEGSSMFLTNTLC